MRLTIKPLVRDTMSVTALRSRRCSSSSVTPADASASFARCQWRRAVRCMTQALAEREAARARRRAHLDNKNRQAFGEEEERGGGEVGSRLHHYHPLHHKRHKHRHKHNNNNSNKNNHNNSNTIKLINKHHLTSNILPAARRRRGCGLGDLTSAAAATAFRESKAR